MDFNLKDSIQILERTPQVLFALLSELNSPWIENNEGDETWSPFDIVGHLIHGEKTDWIPRMQIILSSGSNKTFMAFDRFAQFEESKGKNLLQMLNEFQDLREHSLFLLKSQNLNPDLDKIGIHPVFGEVTLRELLSTWVVHDLGHIAQISRVMAKQYKNEVGPWRAYLPILDR